MKFGFTFGYWGAQPPSDLAKSAREAESMGFDSLWTAEAWGSDAVSTLAWIGANTEKVKLGTSIIQLSGRTPTATAMAALTLDHLSHGRVILGLGVSGPQVVEGWYGQPYAKPLARTREYIDIIRKVLAREEPVTSPGPHYPLPYPGGTGLGKPLRPIVHPLRADLPIMLAAEGPKNVALAAEICDGWLPIYFAPSQNDFYKNALAEGFSREGAKHDFDSFEVAATVPVVPLDDVEAAVDFMRPMLALYIGGMGAKEVNFHFDVFCRMGYEAEANKIQDLYLDGKKNEAAAVVTRQMVEEICLVGSKAKILDELQKWNETVVTSIVMGGPPEMLPMLADVFLS